jgi:hypothetical protein
MLLTAVRSRKLSNAASRLTGPAAFNAFQHALEFLEKRYGQRTAHAAAVQAQHAFGTLSEKVSVSVWT